MADVALALEQDGIEAGRSAVARIVGRDTAALDAAGVARAAIESLAENFSDGVVAPVLWLAIAGLPGTALYKAINTADSMIGHRTPRYEAFGWAAARLDDLVNLPASRLSALLLVAAAALHATTPPQPSMAHRAARRATAIAHPMPAIRKPRWPARSACRWPARASTAACVVDDAMMGNGRRDAKAADIRRALALYRSADAHLDRASRVAGHVRSHRPI